MIEQFLQKKIADLLGEFVEVILILFSSKKASCSVCRALSYPNQK
jgi:hypothetical protein